MVLCMPKVVERRLAIVLLLLVVLVGVVLVAAPLAPLRCGDRRRCAARVEAAHRGALAIGVAVSAGAWAVEGACNRGRGSAEAAPAQNGAHLAASVAPCGNSVRRVAPLRRVVAAGEAMRLVTRQGRQAPGAASRVAGRLTWRPAAAPCRSAWLSGSSALSDPRLGAAGPRHVPCGVARAIWV